MDADPEFVGQFPAGAEERILAMMGDGRRQGQAHPVAVNSATSALHIACMALDVGPGDWVWTSPVTFVASANCAIYCGAKVDFVDIDPRYFRPLEVDVLRGDASKAESRLGWSPTVTFKQLVRIMLSADLEEQGIDPDTVLIPTDDADE